MPLADLLRQSVYSRLAGHEDVNDAERLSEDPTFRLIGSEQIWERDAARTSRVQSLETELLAEEENLAGLARINRELIGSRSRARRWCLGADGAFAKPGIYEALGERGRTMRSGCQRITVWSGTLRSC